MTPEKKLLVVPDMETAAATDDRPPDPPSVDDATKALDDALERATAGTPGLWCFVSVMVGASTIPCGRPREKAHDVCCAEHWKHVPSKLRREMNDANNLRSQKQRERRSLLVADKIMDHLAGLLVQLPPVQQLARDEPRIIRPGEVARPDQPGVISPKLILPTR